MLSQNICEQKQYILLHCCIPCSYDKLCLYAENQIIFGTVCPVHNASMFTLLICVSMQLGTALQVQFHSGGAVGQPTQGRGHHKQTTPFQPPPPKKKPWKVQKKKHWLIVATTNLLSRQKTLATSFLFEDPEPGWLNFVYTLLFRSSLFFLIFQAFLIKITCQNAFSLNNLCK